MRQDMVKVATASGQLEAQILRSMLEAQGIQVLLLGESAGTAIGLGVGPLAEVNVMVLAHQADQARELIKDYYAT